MLQFAGASLHRDALDELVADDVANGKATMTGSGLDSGFINSQDDVKSAIPSVWPVLEQGQAPKDTDGDGMPDEWETAHGLNANDAADGNQKGEGGYTNLEVYLNGIVAHITAAQNEGGEQTGYIEEVIVPGDDNEPGKTLVGAGSVNWKLDAGNAGQTATYADQIADEIGKNSIILGSNISYGGTQAITGAGRITKFQSAVKNEALANDGNAVAFSFTMADGYFFRPTKVAFYACRCGTDGGRLDIYWQTPDEKKELELGLTPERNNNYTAFEKEDQHRGLCFGHQQSGLPYPQSGHRQSHRHWQCQHQRRGEKRDRWNRRNQAGDPWGGRFGSTTCRAMGASLPRREFISGMARR